MNHRITISSAIICISILLFSQSAVPAAIAEKRQLPTIIKVLLDEQKKCHRQNSWRLSSENGFIIKDLDTKKQYTYDSKELLISIDAMGAIKINADLVIAFKALIKSPDNNIAFNEKVYSGMFLITNNDIERRLINCVELETYVAIVVRSESWPGWPLEVNKVQAIASRTYVINKMHEAQRDRKEYHVKSTNADQVYKGIGPTPAIQQAVNETKGIILIHDNKPIKAMFDASCGGIIPADIDQVIGMDIKDFPYLQRKSRCDFCKKTPRYAWNNSFTMEEIELLLKKELKDLNQLKKLKIIKKDKAGIVNTVAIHGLGQVYTLTSERFKFLLQKTKSFAYSLKKNNGKITLEGVGYGHHLGLCQWGSFQMHNEGWNYKDILSFYYPNTTLMRL